MNYKKIRPLLFTLPAEAAHGLAIKALKSGLMRPSYKYAAVSKALVNMTKAQLKTQLWHLNFPSPVGLAAGFDKNAEAIAPLLKLGFGFVECGTVTPRPQAGNPKPRIFRAPKNSAIINRMGFPGRGMYRFKDNLRRFLETRPRAEGIVGLNIGMNKDQSEPIADYKFLMQYIGAMGDYITINISSPNTPGLRDLQKREPFLALCAGVIEARSKYCGEKAPPPILVKLAPDLDEAAQEELAAAALESGIDGLILTNTTLDRPDYLPSKFAAQKGGLSGRPVKDKATQTIHNFYRLTKGQLPIIGVGGIENAQDAYDKIKAGASLVQLYSALVFEGPDLPIQINQGLIELLAADGYTHISDAVGADHKRTL
jgi:dihydroorotate dehydrogenase